MLPKYALFPKKSSKNLQNSAKNCRFCKDLKNLEKYKWNGQLEISFFEKKNFEKFDAVILKQKIYGERALKL